MLPHRHRDPNWTQAEWGWRRDVCRCGAVRWRGISNLAAPMGFVDRHGCLTDDTGWRHASAV